MNVEQMLHLQLSPSVVETDPNLAFLYELYLSKGLSEKVQFSNSAEDENFFTDFEKFFENLDLSPEVEDELEDDNKEKNITTIHKLTRNQKLSVYDFFQKIHSFKHTSMEKQFDFDPFVSKNKTSFNPVPINEDIKFYFENITGNNPRNWPMKLDEFVQTLQTVPPTAFFYQPFKLYGTFYADLEKKFSELIALHQKKKLNDGGYNTLYKTLISELIINFLRGSFYRTLGSLDKIQKISESLNAAQNQQLSQFLVKLCTPVVRGFLMENEKTSIDFTPLIDQIHKIFSLSDLKSYDLNIQDGYAVTTDGTFIYEAVASPNLIHLSKIGTGVSNTEAGIIYKQTTIPLPAQKNISLVYLKNKLFLKYNSENLGSVEVYSPESLEKMNTIYLNLKEYFKNPHLAQYNKFFQLFTDGQYLFTTLLRYKFVKIEKPKAPAPNKTKDNTSEKKKPTTDPVKIKKKVSKEAESQKKEEAQVPEKDLLKEEARKVEEIMKNIDFIDYDPNKNSEPSLPLEKTVNLISKNPNERFDQENLAIFQEQLDQQLIESLIQEERLLHQLKENANRNPNDISSPEKTFPMLFNDINVNIERDGHAFVTPEQADKQNIRKEKVEADDSKDKLPPIDHKKPFMFTNNMDSSAQNTDKKDENGQSSLLFIKNLFRNTCSLNREREILNRFADESDSDSGQHLNVNQFDKINFIRTLENEQILNEDLIPEFLKYSRENLNRRGGRGRGMPILGNNNYRPPATQAKPTTTTAPAPQVEGEKHLIEFCVIKFDIEKQEEKIIETNIQNYLENSLVVELFASFSSYYTLAQCAQAIKKTNGDIEAAAEWLLKESNTAASSADFQPVSTVLIYQTEALGYDFKQQKVVKPFSVVAKSLVTPNDLLTGGWFVKNDLVLKSNGTLFSLNPKDEIAIEPSEIDNIEALAKNKLMKFEELFQNPSSENLEWILKKFKSPEADGLKLPKSGAKDPVPNNIFRIQTTYLKNYSSNPFFTFNANKKIFYDCYNSQFCSIMFDKLPNANYGFLKQRFTFVCDNYAESKSLKGLISIPDREVESSINFLFAFRNSKTVSEYLDTFMDLVFWINKSRPEMPYRLNDWISILSSELKTATTDKGKKSKTNLNAKIKKLIDLKKKSKSEKTVLSEIFIKDEKTETLRELNYAHFLCVKGNFKTLRFLLDHIFDSSIKQSTKEKLINMVRLWTQYFNFNHSVSDLAAFGDYLFDVLKHKDFSHMSELKELLIQLSWVFIPNKSSFMKFFIHAVYHDDDFFIRLMKNIFRVEFNVNNIFPFNNKLLLLVSKDLTVNDKTDKVVEYSLLIGLRKIIGKGFSENFQISELLKELTNKLLIKKDDDWFYVTLKAIRNIVEICYCYNSNRKAKLLKKEKDDNGITAQFEKFKESLILHIIEVLNRIYKNKNLLELSHGSQRELKLLESFLFVLLFKAKIKNITDIEFVVRSVISNVSKNIEYLSKRYQDQIALMQTDFSKFIMKGISQLDTHIVETPHPIERGKNITFKRIFHERAIGFVLEFDKKCQDEESTDSLIITSWNHPEKKGTANLTNDAYINRYINICGKKTFKKPLIMIGNSLDVQFISSNMAKNNAKSLSQWGYKIFIRPIFGQNQSTFQNHTTLDIVTNKFVQISMNVIDNLNICIRIMIEVLLKGASLGHSEKVFEPFLNWYILHRGLTNLDIGKFLIKSKTKEWGLKPKMSIRDERLTLHSNESERTSMISRTNNEKISLFNEDYAIQDLIKLAQDKSSNLYNMIFHVKSLVTLPFSYQAEKRRMNFKLFLQKYWEEIDGLMIICFLHHSNIISLLRTNKNIDLSLLTSQTHIKEQLQMMAKKRNDCLNFMIQEVKIEQEYQDNFHSIYDLIKHEYTNRYITKRIEKFNEEERTKEEKLKKEEETKKKKDLIKKKILSIQMAKKTKVKKPKALKETSKNTSQADDMSVMKKEENMIDDSSFYYFVYSEVEELLLDKDIRNNMKKILTDSFEGKTEDLKKLFKRKELEYTKEPKENFEILVKFILNKIKEEIMKSNIDNKLAMQIALESPYQIIGDMMMERVQFLLKLNCELKEYEESSVPPNPILTLGRGDSILTGNAKNITDSIDDEPELKPLGYARCLTSETKIKPKDFNIHKNEERNWVDVYKTWKLQMNYQQEDLKSSECSPIFSVNKFLTIDKPLKIQTLQSIMLKASNRASLRIIGLQLYKTFLAMINGTWAETQSLCMLPASFVNMSLFDNIQTTHSSLKETLAEISLSVSKLLMARINELSDTLKSLDVLEIYRFNKNLELDDMQQFENQLDSINGFFKQVFIKQSEIFTLINSHEFTELVEPRPFNDQSPHKTFRKLIISYLRSVVELNLFLIGTRNISFDFRDTSILMKRCLKINNVIIRYLFSVWKDEVVVVQLLTGLLQIELGERAQSNTFIANVFNRMSDSVGEERLVFILKNLRISLRNLIKSNFKVSDDNNYIWEILKDKLMIIIFSSQNSRIIKICLRCLEILNEGFQVLGNILEEDIFKRVNFVEILCDKVTKNQFMTKFAPYNSKAQTQNKKIVEKTVVNPNTINDQQSNNLLNILHKIGDLALPKVVTQRKESPKTTDSYALFLHMLNEEDLCPLIRVLYHWENLYPSFTKRLPKTMTEYYEFNKKGSDAQDKGDKKLKKTTKPEQAIQLFQQMTNKMRLKENIIQNVPDFNMLREDLPIGWYLNNSNVFKNFKISRPHRKLMALKTTRKMWETKNFNKLLFTITECLKLLKPPVFVNVDKKAQDENVQKEVLENDNLFVNGYDLHILFDPDFKFEDAELNGNPNANIVLNETQEKQPDINNQPKLPEQSNEEAQVKQADPVKEEIPKEVKLENLTTQLKAETTKPSLPLPKPVPEPKPATSNTNQHGRSYVNLSKEEQIKIEQEFLETHRLLFTLLEICKYVQNMYSFLNFTGYTSLFWTNGIYVDKHDKIEEFAYLINMLLHKKMNEIPSNFINDDNIMKKIAPVLKFVNEKNFNLDLSVSIVKSSIISSINKYTRYAISLKVPHENFVKYANKYSAVYQNLPQAKSKTFIIKLLSNFVKSNINSNIIIKQYIQNLYQKLFHSEYIVKNDKQDERIKLGLLVITTNWMSEFSIGDKIRFPLGDQEFKIVGLPETTGKKNLLVINEKEPKGLVKLSDSNYTDNDYIPFDDSIIEKYKNCIAKKILELLNQPPARKNSTSSNSNNLQALQDKNIANKITLTLLLKLYLMYFKDDDSQEAQNLKARLLDDYIETSGNFKEIEKSFVSSIERLIDAYQNLPIHVLEHYQAPETRYPFELERRKASIKIEELLNTRCKDFDSKAYISSKSTYISGMPMTHPRSSDYKMLKHWEKHIIPKILSFVKGSLSAYEIEDFFEQMRIELRKENQVAASNIAYILCDQKLPNDCTLPELNYDWGSLDVDELKIGQYVCVKIKDDRNLFSHVFEQYFKLGIYHVFGIVCFKDPVNMCVNVLIRDVYQNNIMTVWVPQQAIKPIEVPIEHSASAFPIEELITKMELSFSNFYKVIIREYFFNEFLHENKQIQFDKDFKTMKLLIQKELKGKCLGEWLQINGSMMTTNTKNKNLNRILDKIETQSLFHQLADSLEQEANYLVTFFQSNNYSFDMTTRLESDIYTNEKVGIHSERNSRLNIFDRKEEVAGLVIEYKNNSNIFKCSGIKFFSDIEGINLVKHIQATQKSSIKNLYPLVFDFPEVYYQFYYNSEALPVYMKSQSTSKLDCTVFAIPYSWNYLLWSLDIISSYAIKLKDIKLLTKCYRVASQLFTQFKGPNLCKQFLLKIMSRLMIKIKFAFKKLPMSIDEKADMYRALALSSTNFNSIILDFEFYLESTQDDLYSSLLQDLSEYLAIYSSIVSTKMANIDDNIKSLLTDEEKNKFSACLNVKNSTLLDIKSLFSLAEFISNPSSFQSDKNELKDLWNLFSESLNPAQFYNNFIMISNIPAIHIDPIKLVILEAIKSEKLKVLSPDFDIYIPSNSDDIAMGYAIILYDGWEFLDPSEIQFSNDKIEEEEPVAEEEKQWECEVCTLLNVDSSVVCIACESPKPQNPVYPNEIKKLEEAKAKKSEELEGIFSVKHRQKAFKDAIMSGFNRLTPDKRIEFKIFKASNMTEIESSNEILEFFLFRITSETFQAKLSEISKKIYAKFKTEMQLNYSVDSPDALYDFFVSLEPIELFEKLAEFGYDFWLEKSGLSKYQSDNLKLINKRDMERFLEFIEHDICYESAYSIEYSGFDFRLEFKTPLSGIDIYAPNAVDKLRYKESKIFFYKLMKYNNYSNFTLRTTITAIQRFNKLLKKYYKLLNISSPENANGGEDQQECLSLGSLISNLRDFWLSGVKEFICNDLLNNTALVRDETPKVHIERLTKEREIMVDKRNDTINKSKKEGFDERNFIFLQAYKQMAEISPSMLRPVKPKGSEPFICFEIVFKGEHVMGEAGPYRQFYSDISAELQPNILNDSDNLDSKHLSLFIPSPNRANQLGDFKDKYVINPSNKSSYYLQLYEFLGMLMGCAFRTGTFLTLDLPTMFWKKIVGQQINEDDIDEVDKGIMELVRFFKESPADIIENDIFQTFTAMLSDKSIVELVPNGKNIKVTYENKGQFIEKFLEARLGEADVQIEAVRKGIVKIIPEVLLNCLNAKDLEKRICGKNLVDFNLLKKCTRYSGNLKEDSTLIKDFWDILFSLPNADKLRFVKFCWGQERLPSTSQGFENASIRFMIKPAQYSGSQDGLLPRADTCFFNFELPNYSSKEIMKEKILLAIHTDCDSMNAEEAHSEHNQPDEQNSWASYSETSYERL